MMQSNVKIDATQELRTDNTQFSPILGENDMDAGSSTNPKNHNILLNSLSVKNADHNEQYNSQPKKSEQVMARPGMGSGTNEYFE